MVYPFQDLSPFQALSVLTLKIFIKESFILSFFFTGATQSQGASGVEGGFRRLFPMLQSKKRGQAVTAGWDSPGQGFGRRHSHPSPHTATNPASVGG